MSKKQSWYRRMTGEPLLDDGAIDEIWSSVSAKRIEVASQVIDSYADFLRSRKVNGGVIVARFALVGAPALSALIYGDYLKRDRLFERLVLLPDVRESLPELTSEPHYWETAECRAVHSLTLGGEMARDLLRGGAYHQADLSTRAAKDLSEQVCDALFGDRFDDIKVLHSTSCWSAWFHDVHWDSTWIVIDRAQRQMTIIASTDTD